LLNGNNQAAIPFRKIMALRLTAKADGVSGSAAKWKEIASNGSLVFGILWRSFKRYVSDLGHFTGSPMPKK
jgi:hypothetical protein